jgi:DNA repair exonuclease SbcCD nuclease subunit
MDTLKIKPKNNKILFFSDLHLGVHQNSNSWIDLSLKVADFIADTMDKHKIDTIIFAGDAFHDRHEIGVNTLHGAKTFFERLSEYNIFMIPGNHDAFLSSTAEVNSIEILTNKKISVFSKPVLLEAAERKIFLCPWKSDYKTFFNDSDIKSVDMIVGHFELVNFKMNSNKICDHGDCAQDLFLYTNSIVTGHFHCRDLRKYEDDKYVLYLGSPYEMDFGDRGQEKGVTIISLDDLSTEFIKNDTTPKHIRLLVSEIIEKKYKDLQNIVNNNIVSLYVDVNVDTLIIDQLITKLLQYNPFQFRTEFNIIEKAQQQTKDIKKLSIDIETAFHEFIDHVETRATKKEVLDKCLELYKNCLTSHE